MSVARLYAPQAIVLHFEGYEILVLWQLLAPGVDAKQVVEDHAEHANFELATQLRLVKSLRARSSFPSRLQILAA